MKVDTKSNLEILKGILEKFPDHGFNDYQIEMLSTGYEVPELIDIGYTPEIYFKWLSDSEDTEGLLSKYRMVTSSRIRELSKEKAKEHGWSIVSVGPGDGNPGYCYTTYLTDKVGYELILVGHYGSIGGSLLNTVCNIVTKEYPDSPPTSVITTNLFRVFTSSRSHDLRLQFVELDMNSSTAKSVILGENITRVIQVTMGDLNNILPNEEGYDSSFIQTLSEVVYN